MTREERKAYMVEYNKMYRLGLKKIPPAHIRRFCDCGEPAEHFISSAWVCDLCRKRDIVAKELQAHNTAIVSAETKVHKVTTNEYLIAKQQAANRKWAHDARQRKKLKQHAAVQHALAIADAHCDS